MTVIENAVSQWLYGSLGSDVSEDGFTRDGIAVVPQMNRTDLNRF